MGQTAASATAATWASQASRPVLAMTAASLAACSASRSGATSTLSSRSRPRRASSASLLRASSDAAAIASAERTRGCPRASSSRMRRVTSASARATAIRALTSRTHGVGTAPPSSLTLQEGQRLGRQRAPASGLPLPRRPVRRFPADGPRTSWEQTKTSKRNARAIPGPDPNKDSYDRCQQARQRRERGAQTGTSSCPAVASRSPGRRSRSSQPVRPRASLDRHQAGFREHSEVASGTLVAAGCRGAHRLCLTRRANQVGASPRPPTPGHAQARP